MTYYPDPRGARRHRTLVNQDTDYLPRYSDLHRNTPTYPFLETGRGRVALPGARPNPDYDPTPGHIRPVYTARLAPVSGLAVASLVLGLLGGGLLAIILGVCAMPAINAGRRRGDGMATAGIALGVLGMSFWFVLLMVVTS